MARRPSFPFSFHRPEREREQLITMIAPIAFISADRILVRGKKGKKSSRPAFPPLFSYKEGSAVIEHGFFFSSPGVNGAQKGRRGGKSKATPERTLHLFFSVGAD